MISSEAVKKYTVTWMMLLVCVGSLAAQPARSQRQPLGSITGTVLDETTRGPIPGANITIPGTQLGAVTDTSGEFVLRGVPVGTYSVRVSSVGYTPQTRPDVVVSVARPSVITFALRETSVEFEGVSVTAEYFRKSPDAPVSTQAQSNEEIRRLPGGFEDVVRAVSILPGVAQVQPGRNDLIVRGGAPSENLFVLDGVELPNINHYGTQGSSGGPLSFVNLDFVSGTSFSTGGFGVRYGDKLSSVLTIDLRDGRTDRLGGKATVSATEFGLNLEGPAGPSASMVVSARRSYLDFIFKAAKFSFVPEYWDFLTKADYQLGRKDKLSAVGILALDGVRVFNDTPDKRWDNSRILYSDQITGAGGVSWRHLFSAGYASLALGQSYYSFDTHQVDTLLEPVFKNSSFEYESSLRADAVYEASRGTELSAGIQLKAVRFRSDLVLSPFVSSFGQSLSVAAVLDTLVSKGAAYIQASQTLERLRLTFGLRSDYFQMIQDQVTVSPRISASYALTPVTSLNASVGRYRQAPSYIWLVSNSSNRQLSFAGVNQFVLGIDHALQADTRLSIEGYVKNYFDYPASLSQPFLVMANTGAGYGGSDEGFASFGLDSLASAGSGTARGLELFVQKKLSEVPCYGIVSLSYNEAMFSGVDGISRPGSFDQRWILNIGGGYILNEMWEVSLKFRLATGRPYTPFTASGTQLAADYNSQRVGTNHSLDLRVDKRWSFSGGWVLIAYVDIQNIYNRKPQDVPRYNARTATVETPGAIGILPSVGLSAEF